MGLSRAARSAAAKKAARTRKRNARLKVGARKKATLRRNVWLEGKLLVGVLHEGKVLLVEVFHEKILLVVVQYEEEDKFLQLFFILISIYLMILLLKLFLMQDVMFGQLFLPQHYVLLGIDP